MHNMHNTAQALCPEAALKESISFRVTLMDDKRYLIQRLLPRWNWASDWRAAAAQSQRVARPLSWQCFDGVSTELRWIFDGIAWT
jgi:hypothetical protein